MFLMNLGSVTKINCAVRAQICVSFVLKNLRSYRDNLKIFLSKDGVKMSCGMYELFFD